MLEPLLEVDRLDAFYGDFQALFAVSMKVEAGETVAVIGANGAGKSTLLASIAGLMGARRDAIRFDGAWRHCVGIGAPSTAGFWRSYGAAALREVERVQPRRRFDIVLCPGELERELSPLAALGIRVVSCSGRTPLDVTAAIRATPAVAAN